jgi:hypothetical protein
MENIEQIDLLFTDLESKDNTIRYAAFQKLLAETENSVPWVYDKWYILTDKLLSDNSYQRSIGLMLLANLAKSDTENRFANILGQYISFFEDEKFITSRQCIQHVWKIALCNNANKNFIIKQLEISYNENKHLSPHGNLIKQDIISSLYQIYKHTNDTKILTKVNELIDAELDSKMVKTLKKILNK